MEGAAYPGNKRRLNKIHMKVVIVEDEKPAADKLELLLKRYDPDIEVIQRLDSVAGSVEWFGRNAPAADLVFMDIRLTDGISFEIFRQVRISKPVIFTTAYNEYALEAFRINSIDYLLKPVSYDDLFRSMNKLSSLRENLISGNQRIEMEELAKVLDQYQHTYKQRFMVKVGDHIRSIPVEQITMFYADGRVVYIFTGQGREFIVDFKMEELDEVLDPKLFFRINRTFTLHINGIKDVIIHSNSRLKVVLHQAFDEELIVSREKVNPFKLWFGMR
jgi:DNA-binding LytR/AlgR family response regulator